LKESDTCADVRGNLTVIVWKDERDMNILTNMHRPPTEGNFCDEQGKAQKPVTVTDYRSAHGLYWKREQNS